MKNLLLILGMLLISTVASAAGDAAAGKAKTAACVACHNADGNSLAPSFPKLAGQGEKYLYKQLREIKDKTREIAQMAGQLDNMSDQDLQDIAAFYASNTMTGSAAKAELVKSGERIYRAGLIDEQIAACTGCHSPTGAGNAPAGFPRLSGQHADYIAQQLMQFQNGTRTNDAEAVMRNIAERLTAAEIKAVSSYAAGLR